MAVEKGLYEEGAPRPSATEIANLIFSSGFSTADEVTDVSGRGVGMDAVKGFLKERGGDIFIEVLGEPTATHFVSFRLIINLPIDCIAISDW